MSFSVTVRGKLSGWSRSNLRSPGRPSIFSPPAVVPLASTRFAGFVDRTPATDDIVIFEGEAERIDHRVATVASGIGAMLREALPHGGRDGAGLFRKRRIDSRRRRGNRQPEDVIQQPFAPHNRRS